MAQPAGNPEAELAPRFENGRAMLIAGLGGRTATKFVGKFLTCGSASVRDISAACRDRSTRKPTASALIWMVGVTSIISPGLRVESQGLPAELMQLSIAPGRYAVFGHAGHISSIGRTWMDIFETWAPKSGFALASAPSFECYTRSIRPCRSHWQRRYLDSDQSIDEPDCELGPGEFRRDGRILSAPNYGGDDTDANQRDDVVEGELAPPATMIGHETAVIEEPEPAVVEAIEPVPPPPAPEFAAARYERERVAAWICARLTPYPMERCCYCRLPFNVGQQWQEMANDEVRVRFHAACHSEWFSGREAAARQALGLEG